MKFPPVQNYYYYLKEISQKLINFLSKIPIDILTIIFTT